MFLCEFCEIFKNTRFYRTALVAASEFSVVIIILRPASFIAVNVLVNVRRFSDVISVIDG